MPELNWSKFDSLSGGKTKNFEDLCRALMRLHYGQFGQFKALANQPGVEFHLKLDKPLAGLGAPPQWFGWQCKVHTRNQNGSLPASAKADIKKSLETTRTHLPKVTDWILWSPYTLSKDDQTWFFALDTSMKLHLWGVEELDTYLNGCGLLLREAYFGELILTPEVLNQKHAEAIQPIKSRWLEEVHQATDTERTLNRMLGAIQDWNRMEVLGDALSKAVQQIEIFCINQPADLVEIMRPFTEACETYALQLKNFYQLIVLGDLELTLQTLSEATFLLTPELCRVPRLLRNRRCPLSFIVTNALDDMRHAIVLFKEIEDFLRVGLIAVLAEAGAGKTQLAAQLTTHQHRPAGILLLGKNLRRGQNLNILAQHFVINGIPVTSMEALLAALDAAGRRSKCRLPLVIDGLNEAENPSDWKDSLAVLLEQVKRFPYVLIICTLRTGERTRSQHYHYQDNINQRETFAEMALPNDIRKIELHGFGLDVDEAIEKYFRYFKIKAQGVDVPKKFLRHPLTLRIFCETTNPDRIDEVNIDYFPASLSSIFERYIEGCCIRVVQLLSPLVALSVQQVKISIYHLGLLLWEANSRELDEKIFKSAISDNTNWNLSLVNFLAQEGVIFRNPSEEFGEFVVTPLYDALGGYIIADALLKKNNGGRIDQYFNQSGTLEKFVGENNHPLATDIFKALVAISPQRSGTQLWKILPANLKNNALLMSTEIEREYIDHETVAEVKSLLLSNSKAFNHIMPKLLDIASIVNHPLNINFLTEILMTWNVSERDLKWTEWVRSNKRELLGEVLKLENKWKVSLEQRLPVDALQAKSMSWLLTSTDHELRDVVTRALYWYGRGDAKGLFEYSILALEINDPYVSERMLAASYGVAMARHMVANDDNFQNHELPNYVQQLYQHMFTEGARKATTHYFSREYAAKTIELALTNHSDLLSPNQQKQVKPPYKHELTPWGESRRLDARDYSQDSPFHMDFENYTLGRLVPGRNNYDNKHEDYREIRAKILWRVEQLGWNEENFKNIDSEISRSSSWSRQADDAKKTDRYGKKYSWIAYHEMQGYLFDQQLLEGDFERPSSIDIDPSFPNPVTQVEVINESFLGSNDTSTQDWIESILPPALDSYLKISELASEEGPWVMLDGLFGQQDETLGRRLYCYIRSFIVQKKYASIFLEHLSKQDTAGQWLPEKIELHYTFAGEIPWSNKYQENELSEFEFITKEDVIKVKKMQQKLLINGEDINQNPKSLELLLGNDSNNDDELNSFPSEHSIKLKFQEIEIEVDEPIREYAQFHALIPVCDFNWESYHSSTNQAGHAVLLAKQIANDLKLYIKPQTFDFYTSDDGKVTFNTSLNNKDYHNTQNFLYMKESFLREYLTNNELTLIYAIWGERSYSTDILSNWRYNREELKKSYHNFRSVLMLSDLDVIKVP